MKTVTLNDHLDCLKELADVKSFIVSNKAAKFPKQVKKELLGNRWFDIYTPILKGKEWLYSYMKQYQPKTAKILLEAGDLYFSVAFSDCGGYLSSLIQEVNGMLINIQRRRLGVHPWDEWYIHGKDELWERTASLPVEIEKAYYYNFSGFGIPCERFIDTGRFLLESFGSGFQAIDDYLWSLRMKKKYLSFFEELIPDLTPGRWCNNFCFYPFIAFLDTRETVYKKKWDVLFVKLHIQDGKIYYIRDSDIENIRILDNPVEALDWYCEHVLLRREGRFDFLPYSSPLR